MVASSLIHYIHSFLASWYLARLRFKDIYYIFLLASLSRLLASASLVSSALIAYATMHSLRPLFESTRSSISATAHSGLASLASVSRT